MKRAILLLMLVMPLAAAEHTFTVTLTDEEEVAVQNYINNFVNANGPTRVGNVKQYVAATFNQILEDVFAKSPTAAMQAKQAEVDARRDELRAMRNKDSRVKPSNTTR